ncbi:hypothetical protein D3C71_1611530 [compost metagenome]
MLGRLVTIDHFDGVAPCLNIVGNQATSLAAREFIVPWVCQTDPGLGRAQGFDGFLQGRPVLLDVAQLAGAQPFAERLGAILDETFTHHPVGEMRASRRVTAVAQLLLDLPGAIQRPRHAFERQFAADFLGA